MNTYRRMAVTVAFCAASSMAVPHQAGAAPHTGAAIVRASGLASCTPRHLDAEYWATCTAGRTPSRVRVGGLCRQPTGDDTWRWTDWITVSGSNSTPMQGRCDIEVHDSAVEVQSL
ncbi:hypothetical protein [Saccharothrix sp. Mg75]|uniref:hypothetical protein n=1 Tax=Saccharothrix sp. Mg75 TaxID=3445357 RepID=UPI003EE90C06